MRSAQTITETSPTITTRGIIIGVNSADAPSQSLLQTVESIFWTVEPVNRFVDVVTTATNSPNPKWFRQIPWNSVNAPIQNLPAPKEGDFVVLGFIGGNADIPYVLSHMPGDGTIEAQANAAAPRPAAPTAAQSAAFGLLEGLSGGLIGLGFIGLGI